MSVVVEIYREELTKKEYERIFNEFLKENPKNEKQSTLNKKIYDLRKTKSIKRLQEISQKIHEKWKFPQTYTTEKFQLKVDADSMEKAGKIKKWLEDEFGPFKTCTLLKLGPQHDYKRTLPYTA